MAFVGLGLFAGIMIPTSFALGFAAATISFTAWNIVVPLLLSVFHLSLRETLFLSVLLDFMNSLMLTFFYGSYGKVDWVYGLIFGGISAAFALGVSIVMAGFIDVHQEMLEGVMYVIPFLLAGGFYVKGYMMWRRRKAKTTAVTLPTTTSTMIEVRDTPNFTIQDIDEGSSDQNDEPLTLPTTQLPKSDSVLFEIPPIEEQHVPIDANQLPRPASEPDFQLLTDDDEEGEITLIPAQKIPSSLFEDFIPRIKRRFRPDEQILKMNISRKHLRYGIAALFCCIMGGLSGVLFVGGGMAFALATASLFRTNVRISTGTGCFICCLTMLALLFSFIKNRAELNGDMLGYYVLLTIPFGVLGSYTGMRLAMKVSDVAIFFFIATVLLALGIIIAAQHAQ